MKDSKVHAKIKRKQKLDIANGTNTVQKLADDLGVSKHYLVQTLMSGSYKPPIERRKRLAKLLNLPLREVEFHFSEESNV